MQLRNGALTILFALQIGLACYLVWSSVHLKSKKSEDKSVPVPQVEPLSALHRVYRTELLNDVEIDASVWDVKPEFFKYLLERKNKNIRSFTANRLTDDSVITYLREQPIKHLVLLNTRVTNRCLADIASMDSLQWLEIRGLKMVPSDVQQLIKAPHLTWLRAHNCGLTDDSLRILSSHPFEWIVFGDNPAITDVGAAYIGSKPLRTVGFNGCSVSDRTALLLSKNKSLDTVELFQTVVTDKALACLSSLPKLKVLKLSATKITDNGLRKFNPPSDLKELTVTSCPGLTKEGIDQFRRQHPLITVISNAALKVIAPKED